MEELLRVVESLLFDIADHYREKLNGVVIYIEDERTIYLLLLLKNVRKISLANRGIIFNYFYNKLKKTYIFKNYLEKFRQSPKIYAIILEEEELSYNIPFVLYIILNGKILFQKNNVVSNAIAKTSLHIINYKGEYLLDFGKIRKGEVKEL